MKRGRKSLQELLTAALKKRDFLPMLVKDTEGVTTINEACAIVSKKAGFTVNPAPLRAMVRDPKNQRRIKQKSSLVAVCNLNRGRPRLNEPVSATA